MSSVSIEKIVKALGQAGFQTQPDLNTDLHDLGLDSLLTALSVFELEKEFGKKLKLPDDIHETFRSLKSIQTWLEDQLK